jgi:predicted permease
MTSLRHAARMLRRQSGLTIVAGIALTLGIGLTTTIFSFVYGALLRGLPFPDADEIVHLERDHLARGVRSMEVTIHDFHDWRAEQRVFRDLAAYYATTVNLSGAEKPERFAGAYMTANAFDVLRVRPLLGRTFRPGEDRPGAEAVIVLGYAAWKDRFGADPRIVGRTVRANGEPATVIGVMPEHFGFPVVQQVWLPMRLDPLAIPRGEGQTIEGFGRLRAGVSVAEASAQMNAVARHLQRAYPATNEGIGVVVQPFVRYVVSDAGAAFLYTMLGAVFLVLLVACANVANMLLSRAVVRSREVGIRTALGASRARVVAEFLTEALALAAVGGVLGTGVAWVGVRYFNDALTRLGAPFFIDVRLDGAALLFVLATTVVTALVAGLLPALQASGADVAGVLKDETRGTSSFRLGRMSRAIVVGEVALSCGLLVAAGLMVKSVARLGTADYGFERAHVLTARVALPEAQYPDAASRLRFFETLQARLAALPGVEAASLGTALPAVDEFRRDPVEIEGRAYATDREQPLTGSSVVAPGYFAAFAVGVRRGRDFIAGDRDGTLPVAIVNEAFARRFLAGDEPIGRRIRLGAEPHPAWRTIVGVAPDLYASGTGNKEPDGVYVPLAQSPQRLLRIALHTRGAPLPLVAAVRDAVGALDADLPIYRVDSLAGALDGATFFYRLFGTVFMIFGGVALFLASVGLYAVMSFAVGRRGREMGIRMALGARPRDVLALVLRQGLLQVGIGLLLGLGLAAVVAQRLSILLFDVGPRDPAVFGAVVPTLLLAGIAACLVPARRATRVDPLVALRRE